MKKDKRLLIVNIDDYGMTNSANAAAVEMLRIGHATSCTVMVPCPWGLKGLELLRENPDFEFGVHLTVISEHDNYKWGPVSYRKEVSSLVPDGRFFVKIEDIPFFIENAKLEEIEREFRAQIELVLSKGLQPTHLDSHCHMHERREDILKMTFELGKEYALPVRTAFKRSIKMMKENGISCIDHEVVDSCAIKTETKKNDFDALIRNLKPGISEFAIHPALDTKESRSVSSDWEVRNADYEYFISNDFRKLIEDENIILTSYRELFA
ncbi:MAG: ChbG/HpnK family deacetylase [Bacteroidetes bacterium]|nr:ChbG/HpnK family deacetylase [Bacteroidota bacterium]